MKTKLLFIVLLITHLSPLSAQANTTSGKNETDLLKSLKAVLKKCETSIKKYETLFNSTQTNIYHERLAAKENVQNFCMRLHNDYNYRRIISANYILTINLEQYKKNEKFPFTFNFGNTLRSYGKFEADLTKLSGDDLLSIAKETATYGDIKFKNLHPDFIESWASFFLDVAERRLDDKIRSGVCGARPRDWQLDNCYYILTTVVKNPAEQNQYYFIHNDKKYNLFTGRRIVE